MGNAGSITAKADISPYLTVFTTWGAKEMASMVKRNKFMLSETFALRFHEFYFLIDKDIVGHTNAKNLFALLDKESHRIVDKYEVMCVIAMTSTLSSKEKVEFIFEVFNFNDKGYLTRSETSLMIRALVSGAYKADPSIGLPANHVFEEFVRRAMGFAVANPESLRRPEVVRFSVDVKECIEFMEAWCGIASPVLIGEGRCWRDRYFLASQTSIAPTRAWLSRGMPPEEFVLWIRRVDIGVFGSKYLFSHSEEILKTPDKKVVYGGPGVIGTGVLKQGLLADRWILNAMAVAIVHPEILRELFGVTGQENVGRLINLISNC